MTDTVLITGASQGTGKATALLFARHGYDVILAARQPERLEQVAAAVRAEGRQALAVPTDTSDVQQVEVLIQTALVGTASPLGESQLELCKSLFDSSAIVDS